MQLTKYEHACFTIEKDGKLMVVDPGIITSDLPTIENVVAIVVTHEHPDHFDPSALGALISHNPDAVILAPDAVTRQLGDTLPHETVYPGETTSIKPFTIQYSGGRHAEIHNDIEIVDNIAIFINETVFYPGDSFTKPTLAPPVLALPVTAPWMKISEAINYLQEVKPTFAFPTHDAIASKQGQQIVDSVIGPFANETGVTYKRLSPGETIPL